MADLWNYDPSWRDRVATGLLGLGMPRSSVVGLMGSAGLGEEGPLMGGGLLDLTPAGVPFWMNEAARTAGTPEGTLRAMALIPGAKPLGEALGKGAARVAGKALTYADKEAQDFIHGYLRSREADTPEKLKQDLLYFIRKRNGGEHQFFPKATPIDENIVNEVPIVRRGKRYGISAAGRSKPRPSIEASDDPIGRAPDAVWGGSDLQDYRKTAKPNEIVEQQYVSLDTLPNARLAGGRTGYDWGELGQGGAIPPVTIRVTKNGKASIVDGNHRIQWFRDQGYDSVPAYIIRPKTGAAIAGLLGGGAAGYGLLGNQPTAKAAPGLMGARTGGGF